MNIVQQVDTALKNGLLQGPLQGAGISVAFDTPDSAWIARRTGPCVNAFLHSVDEDHSRAQAGNIGVVDEEGNVVGYRRPPRHFRLSYLVTVWAQSVQDEHRMLGRLLEWCAETEELTLPEGGNRRLTLRLRGTGKEKLVTEDNPAARLWTTLSIPTRPALDLLITVPLERQTTEAMPAPTRGAALRARQLSTHGNRPVSRPQGRPGRPGRNVTEIG
ncbi:DUF4255 domain-containing protein [Streptomyces sp. AV19]|uniref:DUF4255 domain-containing protein n=1 Tax=Streptomyces sp. AV19 TaxID=2793068 RepID=UPI0018FE65A5|nr:DUF4255 domain-containing protein [Streptomyces sp. AV19]MBH1939190.1 DUF4255 domain-containing protein [Streptomyces sp. AV19]MDG4536920.1 DUF4255 domain-containing protein [Streptomyces sp. AV19]